MNIVTRSELIKRLKNKLDVSSKERNDILDIIFGEISNSLEKDERVEIRNLGSFSLRKRASRIARNPKTGLSVTVADKSTVYFRASKTLKEKINNN